MSKTRKRRVSRRGNKKKTPRRKNTGTRRRCVRGRRSSHKGKGVSSGDSWTREQLADARRELNIIKEWKRTIKQRVKQEKDEIELEMYRDFLHHEFGHSRASLQRKNLKDLKNMIDYQRVSAEEHIHDLKNM